MTGKPICEAYWETGAVFSGEVASISLVTVKNDDGYTHQENKVQFRILEAFRGTSGSLADVQTGMGGGDCGYLFEKGKRYLIYAYRDPKTQKLETSICARTQPLSEAEEDLKYIRGLAEAQGGLIFGTVFRRWHSLQPGTHSSVTPLEGVTVRIVGENRLVDIVTNAKGEYWENRLPPGKYVVDPILSSNLAREPKEVEVFHGSCALVNFGTHSDGRISGRVLNETGRPSGSWVEVSLMPVNLDLKKDSTLVMWDLADATDGTYEIKDIPPGRYLLGINVAEPPSTKAPFPKTFYVASRDRDHAKVIEIADGQKLRDVDFRLLEQLKEHSIKVTVKWPDGRPARNAYVYLHNPDYPWHEIVGDAVQKVNSEGRLTLIAFSGYRYWVHADASQGYKSEACAKPVFITAEGTETNVTLTLSVNSEMCSYDYNPQARLLKEAK